MYVVTFKGGGPLFREATLEAAIARAESGVTQNMKRGWTAEWHVAPSGARRMLRVCNSRGTLERAALITRAAR